MEKWSHIKSAELYRLDSWGDGYFSISSDGHVVVRPERENGGAVDVFELVQTLVRRGIQAPILLRFDGIIRDRVRVLQDAFDAAIKEFEYPGTYRLAYPIKVNQQRHVVDSIRDAGRQHGIGLEVGSKPELMAVFAIHDTPGGLLICNGYKDEEYVELAIMARKLGRRAIIVVEQLYEIETVLQVAGRLGIEPELGLRMNPATKGSGRWEASAGEGARFGLNSYEVMEALRQLKEHGKDHWVSLLHFHVGSQITAINSIKRVLREATRMYTELARLCPSLCFLDIGGGLAVDYDGSRTNFASSMNYTIPEYARDVVWAILSRCREAEVRPPDILSESGRAIVAHHSMLVAEVTDVAPVLDAVPALEPPPSDHPLLKDLVELYETVSLKNCVEVFHDALAAREDTLMRFEQGDLSLEERAYADRTVKRLFSRIDVLSRGLRNMPEDIAKLGASLRDMYFCNFSVFQSLPDLWAVDQLFPIMPIHRLDTEPVRRAVIADLTCDSDGKIENFIDQKAVKPYVRVHELNPVEPYYLAVFLVGAYQEILGDLHNLFGDTNAVHVDVSPDGQVELAEIIEGDTIREVLGYVQFDPHDLLARLRRSIEVALRNGALSPEESAKMLRRFREGLDGYTYFVRES